MPTYRTLPRFRQEYKRLTKEQQDAFDGAIGKFVADLRSGRFRSGLRVKGVQGARGVFEMTWAPDGRATFEYGEPQREGDVHIIWRRIGTHSILNEP